MSKRVVQAIPGVPAVLAPKTSFALGLELNVPRGIDGLGLAE